MQRPDDAKRQAILDTATQLFASRPYHEVRLEDVAAAAHVGKGTLYIYFASKEELYVHLVHAGFAEMATDVERVAASQATDSWTTLRGIVSALIRFGSRYPDLYRVMRNHTVSPDDAEIQLVRRRVSDRIEAVLRDGGQRGDLDDPNPAITAQFILSFVRGALLYPPPSLTPEALEDHIIHVLRHGIAKAVAA